MDFDDLIEPVPFDDIGLFRTISDLTRHMEELTEPDELRIQLSDQSFVHLSGDSANPTPQKSIVARPEPHVPMQKGNWLSQRTPIAPESTGSELCVATSHFEPRETSELGVGGGSLMSHAAAPSVAGSEKLGRRSRRAESIRESSSDGPSNDSDVGGQRYNFRKRSARINYAETRRRVSARSMFGTPTQTITETKNSREEARRKLVKSKSSEFRISISKLVSKVNAEDGSSCTNAPGGGPAAAPGVNEYNVQMVQKCAQRILSAETDAGGSSNILCRKSESLYHSRFDARSTFIKAPQWKWRNWEEFFLLFSAIAAEAHTVRNLKSRREEACRRWLSCMRNILRMPPL